MPTLVERWHEVHIVLSLNARDGYRPVRIMGETTWTPPQGFSSQFGAERPATITAKDDHSTINVTANAGSSLDDSQDRGEHGESISSWQKRSGIDTEKQIRIVKISHMRYQHANTSAATKFLTDFGMHMVKELDGKQWWRGYGDDQYVYYCQKGPEKKFLGGTFLVESYADLEKASHISGASAIEEMADAPGKGWIVTVQDPNGFPVNLIWGQEPAEKGDVPMKIIPNDETDKPRVRKFHRFTPGPAAVHKLGHFGYSIKDFDSSLDFYTHNFNLVPTDFLYISPTPTETRNVGVFMHIDRGSIPVDHHTLFFAVSQNKAPHVHHASFEVHDFDTQNLGHQWLAKQGYTSVWGVGRHILGSQIFDYWWDTSGNMVEHYADGDLVNEETPVGWSAAADEALAIWGPQLPKWFLD